MRGMEGEIRSRDSLGRKKRNRVRKQRNARRATNGLDLFSLLHYSRV